MYENWITLIWILFSFPQYQWSIRVKIIVLRHNIMNFSSPMNTFRMRRTNDPISDWNSIWLWINCIFMCFEFRTFLCVDQHLHNYKQRDNIIVHVVCTILTGGKNNTVIFDFLFCFSIVCIRQSIVHRMQQHVMDPIIIKWRANLNDIIWMI